MTLLYRAVWNDDREELLGAAGAHFSSWLDSKGIGLEIPHEGTIGAETPQGRVEVTVRRAHAGGTRGLQIELVEERSHKGERWTTVLRAIESADGSGWLWVDLSQVADDFTARRIVAAPRLVRELIASGADSRVDQVRLSTEPVSMSATSIAGLIRNLERTLPLIVFSHDPAYSAATTVDRARSTLKALQGSAQVYLLPPDEEQPLRDRVGPELAVWGGAARLYLPNTGARGLRPDRHRVVRPERMDRHHTIAARIFARMLTAVITARRPPAPYETIRRQLWGGTGTDRELIVYADQEIERLRQERDDLSLQLEHLEEEVFGAQADLLAAEEEIARLQHQLGTVWRQIRSGDKAPAVDLSAGTDDDPLVVPTSIKDAVESAKVLLGIVVHPKAPRDLDDLDVRENGPAWASLVWRGLQALDAYACSGYDGNFKAWCQNSGDPYIWPASDKKLAMRESESVESNDRFRRQRLLPVDEAVDPTGYVHMWAHLKIAEGGGPLAPRVYFHDDTRGATGKVHIGFIGPHRHMENTKTN